MYNLQHLYTKYFYPTNFRFWWCGGGAAGVRAKFTAIGMFSEKTLHNKNLYYR